MHVAYPAYSTVLDMTVAAKGLLVKSTNYEATNCAFFCMLLSFHPAWVQTYFSASCSHTYAICVISLIRRTLLDQYKTTGKIIILYI